MADKVTKGFVYDGTFELSFLQGTESVRAAPHFGRAACEIIVGDFKETYIVRVGDAVGRLPNGDIIVIATSEPTDQ